jgi:hypothetical protein
MKETELAQKFIDFFGKEFEIYKEVPAEGFIDFVAKSGNVTIAVEVKLNLNFDVIEQANKNKFYCSYSYIAVPKPKKKHFGYEICEMLGIGILLYNETSYHKYDGSEIIEFLKPKINRKYKWNRLKLEPYMKESLAGAVNDGRITPYKITIKNMIKYIDRHPGCSLKECLNHIDYHWSNISSAKGCVYQWINKGIIKDFKLEKGKLFLNDNIIK